MNARHTPVKAALFAAALLAPGAPDAQMLHSDDPLGHLGCVVLYEAILTSAPPELADTLPYRQAHALRAQAAADGVGVTDPAALARWAADTELIKAGLLAEINAMDETAEAETAFLVALFRQLHRCDARYGLPPIPTDWVVME